MNRLPLLSCFALLTSMLMSVHSYAQEPDYEEQALEILRLYESGQQDTAYFLVETLKRKARFLPVALYVRAQMTPDDRALTLYREVIALEPEGEWADEATFELVRRYIEKKDSVGAHAWFEALKRNYHQSPYISQAKVLLQTVRAWKAPVYPAAPTTTGRTGDNSTTTNATSTSSGVKEGAKSDEKRFSGYALQVGLFPTKEAAERRVKELKSASLNPHIFPKEVKGKEQYALVVGPYKTIEEAGEAKAAVAKACDCGAFTVKVD